MDAKMAPQLVQSKSCTEAVTHRAHMAGSQSTAAGKCLTETLLLVSYYNNHLRPQPISARSPTLVYPTLFTRQNDSRDNQ